MHVDSVGTFCPSSKLRRNFYANFPVLWLSICKITAFHCLLGMLKGKRQNKREMFKYSMRKEDK